MAHLTYIHTHSTSQLWTKTYNNRLCIYLNAYTPPVALVFRSGIKAKRLKSAWGSHAHFLGELDHTAPVWKDAWLHTLLYCVFGGHLTINGFSGYRPHRSKRTCTTWFTLVVYDMERFTNLEKYENTFRFRWKFYNNNMFNNIDNNNIFW